MATKNRYWFQKRGKLGLVEDATGGSVNGVAKKYQSIVESGLSVRYDAVLKNPHFDNKTIPELDNEWGFEGSNPLDQKPLFPEQFHEAIVYKALALSFEITPSMDIQKIQYFEQRYQEVKRKAKAFARRYHNGGTMKIKPTDY